MAKENKPYEYQLFLTEEQAKNLAVACEFYARMRMGQWQEIIYRFLDMGIECDDYCRRRDNAEAVLLAARTFIYPELHGVGHSYGIGKFDDADMAFDVYQVIREQFGDPRGTFSYHQLPKFERVKIADEGSD